MRGEAHRDDAREAAAGLQVGDQVGDGGPVPGHHDRCRRVDHGQFHPAGSLRNLLLRFVDAQAPVYADVLAELAAGAKRSHWMWFVFPQLRVLGRSSTARRYGLASADEARAYAAHPLLGVRLVECSALLLATRGRSAEQIFGVIDAVKLRSCMTLFEAVAPDRPVHAAVLDAYYAGERDALTLEALR